MNKYIKLIPRLLLIFSLSLIYPVSSYANDSVSGETSSEQILPSEETTTAPPSDGSYTEAESTTSDISNVQEETTTSTQEFYPIKSITLSSKSQVYNGKVFKPEVIIKDIRNKIIPSKYYTLKYSSGCKNVGTYTVKITFKDFYSGTVTKQFKITKATQKISAKNIVISVGSSKKKIAKLTKGNGKLTYKTSKSKYVKVNKNGTVTGKRSGKASITITAASTKNYKKTSKKIFVTVKTKRPTIKKCTSTANTTYQKNRKIKYIVIHYTAGVTSKKGTALGIARWYPFSGVSSDFVVDDKTIVQYNGNIKNRYTYHCGGSKYDTKGGSLYKIAKNKNSIGIEVCSTNKAGYITFANDKNYSFSDAAVKNTLELVRYLMDKYDIDADHVIRHYDVTGKLCPGIYGWNADSGSEKYWKAFKKQLE